MRVEEANLIHVSRIEGPYQKVHGGIALPQSRRDTRAPITGLPAPEGSLERDQQPVEARGLGAVAALRGQHAEQPSVLLVLGVRASQVGSDRAGGVRVSGRIRSEEHTSELQSQSNLVCRLLLEKKKTIQTVRT